MPISRLFDTAARAWEGGVNLCNRMTTVFFVVALLNAGGWLWALIAFWHRPALLGIALLVYTLGLRHAVDADHIAAIDNVTRKLLHEGQRPVGVGFFFALGHSAIVIAVAVVAGLATSALTRVNAFSAVGGTISAAISASLLLGLAVMNLIALVSVWRRAKRGDHSEPSGGFGLLCRIIAPAFRAVSQSWHMLIIGLLLGLSFDTATEVTLFGISSAQAANGLNIAVVLVFPVLFAGGMSLVDTVDGALMLRAYEWASTTPEGRLRYNLTITFISALVAFIIGTIEAVALFAHALRLDGGLWRVAGLLNAHFNLIGWLVIALFAAVWAWFFTRGRAPLRPPAE